MRFLQIYTPSMTQAPDPAHMQKVGRMVDEGIADGSMIANGWLGKRATAAARITVTAGKHAVEDPPQDRTGGGGWMAASAFALVEAASKSDAIAKARTAIDAMGDGVLEIVQVGEIFPPPQAEAPIGVIPYLTVDGASEASAFYQKAFAAKEVARMASDDPKRLMHCHLLINGGALMLSDNFPEMGQPSVQRSPSYTMTLVVADGDAWWDRAVKAGCKERMPFAVAPWGDKYGQLTDPFGVTWAINSPPKK
jgi:PhnB protein